MADKQPIPEKREISGIFLFFNNPETGKKEPRVFEDCPEYKQDEWLDTLTIEDLKRLAKMLATTLRAVCEKFDITAVKPQEEEMSFIAIGADELKQMPEIAFEGMLLQHQDDNGEWEDVVLKYGKKENGEESNILGGYKTKDGTVYVASLNGKLLERPTLRVKPDQPGKQ